MAVETQKRTYRDQTAYLQDKPNWIGWKAESVYVPARNPGCFAIWFTAGIALLFRKPARVEAVYYRGDE